MSDGSHCHYCRKAPCACEDEFTAALAEAADRKRRVAQQTEQQMWRATRDALPHIDWSRIENSVTTGMPDLNGCYRGVEVWVEHKVYRGNKLLFRPGQLPWIARRAAAGGRVFVLARRLDHMLLYESEALPALKAAGVAAVKGQPSGLAQPEAVIKHASLILPKPFNWTALERALFS